MSPSNYKVLLKYHVLGLATISSLVFPCIEENSLHVPGCHDRLRIWNKYRYKQRLINIITCEKRQHINIEITTSLIRNMKWYHSNPWITIQWLRIYTFFCKIRNSYHCLQINISRIDRSSGCVSSLNADYSFFFITIKI